MEKFSLSPKQEATPDLLEKMGINASEAQDVLAGIEVGEGNEEFILKMGQIAEEMTKRKRILKKDFDTGEILKEGKTDLGALKEAELKETRKNLTKPSKYVKAAIISGLLATGLAADVLTYGPVMQLIDSLVDSAGGSVDVMDALDLAEVATGVGAIGYSLYKGGRAIYKEIQSRVVANKKVQRVIAFIAGGVKEDLAKGIVNIETMKNKKHASHYQVGFGGEKGVSTQLDKDSDYFNDGSGKTIQKDGFTSENYVKAREELTRMGFTPISRRKYQG